MKKGNMLGVILILVGVAWLIRQTGIISVNWSAAINMMWPLFLVAAGVSMMSGRRKLKVGVWILIIVLFFGYGIYKGNEPDRFSKIEEIIVPEPILEKVPEVEKGPVENEIIMEPGTEQGSLLLALGAVNLKLSDGTDNLLVRLDSNIPNLVQSIEQGKKAALEYTHTKYNSATSVRDFNLELNPTILWTVDANLGAVDGELDLKRVPIKQVTLKLGAGDLDLIIGKQQEETKVNLYAGAAELNIYLPEGAGLKVKSNRLLTDLTFHNIAITKQDDGYISENYDTADQKIEMDIQTAVSKIEIFAQ